MASEKLLEAVQEIQKRAERVDDANVIATYVDDRALVSALGSSDNGVIFGRRGTGKTHALKYLGERERAKGNFVAYIDMEHDIGSTEGRYVDTSIGVAERATRLLVDVLTIVHERLLEDAFEGRTQAVIDKLDNALDHFSEVMVVDQASTTLEASAMRGVASGTHVALNQDGPSLVLDDRSTSRSTGRAAVNLTGVLRHRVHFGALGRILRDVIEGHDAKRCWILIDEWSGVPMELQPYLAEMIRALFFNIPKLTVRIAAVPHRTQWKIQGEHGAYIGIEVGAELFPILDLDEFVVFPARNRAEQTERSAGFFKALLFRHLKQILVDAGDEAPSNADEVVRELFTQVTALNELVRAAEGVPRDALAIIGRAALRASSTTIGTPDIREAAGQLYQTTKATSLNGAQPARQLMEAIQREVLGTRKARAFLLLQDQTMHPLIQQLMDDRLLHLIKRGYSAKDDPGVRYDVLQVDYGCYVHLLGTASAPTNLLGEGSVSEDKVVGALYANVEVPEDDYRAIRRSVLNLPVVLEGLGVGASNA